LGEHFVGKRVARRTAADDVQGTFMDVDRIPEDQLAEQGGSQAGGHGTRMKAAFAGAVVMGDEEERVSQRHLRPCLCSVRHHFRLRPQM
jgi:hypothetical protein